MDKKWWVDFYDDSFFTLTGDNRSKTELKKLSSFLVKNLRLKKFSLVFDQCCGTGVISHALARKFMRTIGIDQSKDYIATARKNDLSCKFRAADAFTFVTPEKCDAAINWWTSFGFLDDDRQNIEMLLRVYESLKPGGWFAIEYSNATCDIKNAKKRIHYKKGDISFTRTYKLDKKRGMRGSTWVYRYRDGNTVKKYGETRLYTPKDVVSLLKGCGFTNFKVVADINGGRFTKNSPRFICLAQKPKLKS